MAVDVKKPRSNPIGTVDVNFELYEAMASKSLEENLIRL